MANFPNRKLPRLKDYDYKKPGMYSVTSCVHGMKHCFGKIQNSTMILSEAGLIVQKQWYWLQERYDYVQLHTFQIMPNHIHGIIEIKKVSPDRRIKSLSGLMGVFKTTSSKQIHLFVDEHFDWQDSFNDRIIRNHDEFLRIDKYIRDNPKRWGNK